MTEVLKERIFCKIVCWGLSLAGGGYLAYTLIYDFGQDQIQAAVLGIVAMLLLGYVLRSVFCRPKSTNVRDRVREVQARASGERPLARDSGADHSAAVTAAATAAADVYDEPPVAFEEDEIAEPTAEENVIEIATPRDADGDDGDDDDEEAAAIGVAPTALEEPREGSGDNLKMIKGIGPQIEKTLNTIGVFHFDQIANFNWSNFEWIAREFSEIRGAVQVRRWKKQATILAEGGETEFSQRVKAGEVY